MAFEQEKSGEGSSRLAWDEYWRSDRLAACMRNEEGNYSSAIAEAWENFFSLLPDHASILDIATGNGAVALLALDHSDRAGRHFSITGVDRADIDPPAALPRLADRLKRIDFIGKTPSEHLSFESGSFDAATAQYALEYTDMAKSLVEIARVLKPGGQFMCICHSADSGVYAETLEQIETTSGISALQLIPALARLLRAEAGSAEGQSSRAAFDERAARSMQLMQRASPQGQSFITQVLTELGEIYKNRQTLSPAELDRRLERLDFDLSAHLQRLRDLQAAALTHDRLKTLEKLLASGGFKPVASEPLIDAQTGHCLGHRLQADRLE